MKISKLHLLVLIMFLTACNVQNNKRTDKAKQEIIEAERAFNNMAENEGIAAAFLHFAADSAVLMRNNKLIVGKVAIEKSFGNSLAKQEGVSLTWEPDFVDVAKSGDLGYTYGKYIYSVTDSSGVTSRDTGIFHTVWKLQENGEWKFVWD
ncbi:YybH family protein [Maribellus sediminis]|uniref:YybH family protein n=1 Tax=Maribellus sediminis TaxID=2696285 RepID=UPI001431BA29|nr:DUF4440 domain-containing protein [Maribellus sediminis]